MRANKKNPIGEHLNQLGGEALEPETKPTEDKFDFGKVEPEESEPLKFEEKESGTFEIAPGMTVEEMSNLFFNTNALKESPERVYRLNSSGHRYYYTFDESGQPQFFVSVTTFIKQTMPTSPFLIKWIADMGYEESKIFAQERANYGTFMHTQISELAINNSYNLNTLKGKLKDYIEREQLPSDFINYADDLKKDILAFAQFMIDTDFVPLAIELVLTHPFNGYGGALDLAGEFNQEEKGFFGEVYKSGINKGQPKESKKVNRIRAIIDLKSGRKGFYEESEIQLHAYKEMWNLRFESTPIDRVFNWSPKDWTGKTPTYNFKDQSYSKSALKLPYLVELARIEDDKRNTTIVATDGIINLSKSKDLNENIQEFTLSELVKKRKVKEEEKPEKKKKAIPVDKLGGKKAKTKPVSDKKVKKVSTPTKEEKQPGTRAEVVKPTIKEPVKDTPKIEIPVLKKIDF